MDSRVLVLTIGLCVSSVGAAQAQSVFATGAIGIGPVIGADTLFKSSPAVHVRLGFGLRTRSYAFELSAIHEDYLDAIVHRGDYACLAGAPCPVNYRYDGLSAAIWTGRPDATIPSGLQLGAGIYRVVAEHPYQRPLADALTLGLHLDVEAPLIRGPRSALLLGIRPTVFMNVHNSRPWSLPLELRLRFR